MRRVERLLRRRGEQPTGQVVEEAAAGIRYREGDVIAEGAVEGVEAALGVGVLRRLDLTIEIGMRAQRALREGDQRARQDVGALDGDADGNHLIGRLEVIGRPIANGAAAVNVEGVVDGAAHALGRRVFHQRGNHRRALAARHHGRRDAARRFGRVGRLHEARQRLLDTLHAPNRQTELLADAGVGARHAQHHLGAGGGARRQRDGAPGGEALHQHAPALARPWLARR